MRELLILILDAFYGQGEGVWIITHKNDREEEDGCINIVNVFHEECLNA